MGYTHYTYSEKYASEEDKKNAYLYFDKGEVSKKLRKKVVEKFLKLESEVEEFRKIKRKEFEEFLTENDLSSGMGNIGKLKT
jgi:hypothetical protein